MFDISTLDNIKQYKLLPTYLWSKDCFACGEKNDRGLHMQFYTDDKYLFSKVFIQGDKRGWDTLAHGGITTTILDEMMAWTAIYITDNIILTKTLTVNFKSPVYIEEEVKAVSWIHEQTKKEITLKGLLYNHKNDLCLEATGIYAAFSRKVARKLNLLSENSLNNFDKFLEKCHN